MTSASRASPEQIEHQIAATRSEISATLDAIQARFSPARVVNEVLGIATSAARGAITVGDDLRHATGDFAVNFGQTVRDNPVPVALLGIGLAWLIVSSRQSANGGGYAGAPHAPVPAAWPPGVNRPPYGYARRRAEIRSDNPEVIPMTHDDDTRQPGAAGDDSSSTSRVLEGKAETVKETMAEIGSEVRARAAGMTDTARETLHSATDEARHYADRAGTATREYAARAGETARDAGRSAMRFAEEHPVLVAVGLFAAGAAIASLLPRTRREDRLMGERADATRSSAQAAAREAKHRASAAVDAARDAVSGEGPHAESGGAAADRPERSAGGNGWPTAH